MQIFTTDQIIQMVVTTMDINSKLFGVLLNAVGENIVTYSSNFWISLMSGDLKSVLIFGFILLSMIVFGYRLVRKKLLGSITYLLKS